MATASHIELSPSESGLVKGLPVNIQSAKTASQLLQKNHDDFHIFFNADGFHNHIAHHLLTIYGLGATESELQKAYDANNNYQRSLHPVKDSIVESLSDRGEFAKYLGNEKYYNDYKTFFQQELQSKGLDKTINEHIFAGDEHADALLVRMYAGFLHPIIHLGFGVEFKQPAVIAEALAQAAVHSSWIGDLLLPAEKVAKEKKSRKTLFELLEEIQDNKKIIDAPSWSDGNKIRDGILARAGKEMIDIASQWRVRPEDLEEKTAEMIDAAAYFTGAAQHPPKQIKFDFYFMHCFNCSIFFSTFLKQDWISPENKARALEWKGRLDLAMYASRKSPQLLLDEIKDYQPKKEGGTWADIFKRVDGFVDDGHSSKFIRALANGERVTKPFAEKNGWPISGDSWLQLARMVMDSVEDDGDRWVRSAGFPEAWEKFHDRVDSS